MKIIARARIVTMLQVACSFSLLVSSVASGQAPLDAQTQVKVPAPQAGAIRVATFNVALNRKTAGELANNLRDGDAQAAKIAAIIQSVRPDVLLVNELDYDADTAKLFLDKYLRVAQPQAGKPAPESWLEFSYACPVNTGIDSKLDLNNNDRLHDSDDAWGYGAFPGQYGFAIFSRFPIAEDRVRTFQTFRWSEMPGALRPMIPSKEGGEPKPFHRDEVWKQLRLSSKSHCDVPIQMMGKELHVIASHPTPPVFDGAEDRNGCRNHDEIRMLHDYVSGDERGAYLVDDRGQRGPIAPKASFVILGDLNADPEDGDGLSSAIRKLLADPRVANYPPPMSLGGIEASTKSGQANLKHRGNPANDTGDFNDKLPGNLRIDFVLPSADCKVVASGVYWPSTNESPSANELAEASDHRLVWVDVVLP